MDAPCEPGVKILGSTTATASLCRFIPNASNEQIADQQNAILGMLRRLEILGPILWAAYWGDSDLVDCECLWVVERELAELYAYLDAGIASGTGMPELQSSSFGKLSSDSGSVAAMPKASKPGILPTHSSGQKLKPVQRRRKKRKLTDRERAILAVLRNGEVHSTIYCNALELKKIPPRQEWIDEGCPSTYPRAYKIKKWRPRIQDEKYRLSHFLPKKRARGSSETSATRRKRVNL